MAESALRPDSSTENLEAVTYHFRLRGESQNASMFMPSGFEAGMFLPSQEFARRLLGTFDCQYRVLDIGCGVGLDLVDLSASSNQVWGVDITKDRVEDALRNSKMAGKDDQIHVQVMDAHHLQFPNDFFDLVFANSFLMWVDKKQVLSECRRVLKPGGRALFAMESMRDHPLVRLYRMLPRVRRRESLVNRLSLAEINDLRSGFSSLTQQQFYLLSPLVYPLAVRWSSSQLVQQLVRFVHRIDEVLLTQFPSLRRFAWIAVLQFTK